MERRLKKQLLIGSIFFAVIFAIGGGIWWLSLAEPSCSDGIQNRGEEGVDCGGPCELCLELGEIQILEEAVIPIGERNYALLTKIRNPNFEYGLKGFDYQVKLFKDTEEIGTKEGSSYLLPKETKYLTSIFSNEEIIPTRVEFVFSDGEWSYFKDFEQLKLLIFDKKYEVLLPGEAGFAASTGRLVNRTNYDFKEIRIKVVLYNEFNKPIGVNYTTLEAVLSGEERAFKMLWLAPTIGEEVREFVMEAETNVFDPNNFLKRKAVPEEFQSYPTGNKQ